MNALVNGRAKGRLMHEVVERYGYYWNGLTRLSICSTAERLRRLKNFGSNLLFLIWTQKVPKILGSRPNFKNLFSSSAAELHFS